MKKFIVLPAFFALALCASAQKKPAVAEVSQLNGLYIFVDSKPLSDFKHLGTVTLTRKDQRKARNYSGQYTNVKTILVSKARAAYPDAGGVILHLYDGGTDKADVIKFN